jgi:large-conductance mechanosensitive channel
VVKGPDVVVAVVIGEAEVSVLRTLAESILIPSRELSPLRSVNDKKRRDFVSSATRKGTMTFNA